MKKFLKWFKNSTKIKRWLFLIITGMILICFGFSKMQTQQELKIIDLLQIVITFVAGFVCFVIGIIYIQRRTLEIALETNQIEINKENSAADLVSKDGLYNKGPNIVVIGGGTGLNSILSGLKNYTNNLTAIVSVTSYGMPKSKAEKELKLNPSEDIKNSMIALSLKENEMANLMNYRYTEGKLKDFTFGDIYLSTMQNIYGNFAKSIEKACDNLAITGNVIPVTLDEMHICAELQDGTVVQEKNKISQMVSEKVTKINRVYLSPANCKVAPGVLEAIKNADAIIIGPGSLYTNVIPNLLIKNVAKTIKDSKALKIYISNIMTELGQTDDYSVSEHINSLIEHCGKGIIDFCISDIGAIVPEYVRKYNLMGSSVVEIDTDKIKANNVQLIKGEIATISNNYIRHNPDQTAKLIIELICSDLKFKDKQSDEQYMLLNSKLKEKNIKSKIADKKAKKLKQNNVGGDDSVRPDKKEKVKRPSKFSSKYQDRINSIKESENTRLENLRIHKKAEKLMKEEEQKEKEKFLQEIYNKKTKK